MNEIFLIVSLLLIILGILLIVLFIIINAIKGKSETKTGAFILIGPLPIVIGSDKKMFQIMLIAGIILTILAILLFLNFNLFIK